MNRNQSYEGRVVYGEVLVGGKKVSVLLSLKLMKDTVVCKA